MLWQKFLLKPSSTVISYFITDWSLLPISIHVKSIRLPTKNGKVSINKTRQKNPNFFHEIRLLRSHLISSKNSIFSTLLWRCLYAPKKGGKKFDKLITRLTHVNYEDKSSERPWKSLKNLVKTFWSSS